MFVCLSDCWASDGRVVPRQQQRNESTARKHREIKFEKSASEVGLGLPGRFEAAVCGPAVSPAVCTRLPCQCTTHAHCTLRELAGRREKKEQPPRVRILGTRARPPRTFACPHLLVSAASHVVLQAVRDRSPGAALRVDRQALHAVARLHPAANHRTNGMFNYHSTAWSY